MNAEVDNQAWANFWDGDRSQSEQICPTLKQQILTPLWRNFFNEQTPSDQPLTVLELACGDGFVSQLAQQYLPSTHQHRQLCLDISPAATAAVTTSIDSAIGLVASASQLPLQRASADVIVSQYGLEYAGKQAFAELLRVAAPHCRIMLICHKRGGLIDKECADNLWLLNQFIASQVMPLAQHAFAAGYAILAGNGDQQEFIAADKALAPAVQQLKAQLGRSSSQANKLLTTIFTDLGTMYSRIEHYQQDDIDAWFSNNLNAVTEYQARMQSMVNAALDDSDWLQLEHQFKQAGFELISSGDLLDSKQQPVAKMINARR